MRLCKDPDTGLMVALQGIVGSTAYNLATPESDVDRMGIYVTPTSQIVGLTPPPQSHQRHDPDIAYHEIGKYLRLCLDANPTALELLWLDDYSVITTLGERLLAMRRAFLSNRIRSTYIGYASSQVTRVIVRGDHRVPKHARHVARLLTQAEGLLLTGRLRVRLTDSEASFCHHIARLAVQNPAEFTSLVDERIRHLNGLPSTLPEQPDFDGVNNFLVDCRRDHW